MGISKPAQTFEKAILSAVRMDYKNLKMCELGNQVMAELDGAIGVVSAKPIYISWGVAQHVSIDLNGEDGALPINLDEPVPEEMVGVFDLVTNYGTIEHVNNQFQAFKNVHDMARSGGVMIHTLPPPGHWPRHGRYYYPLEFVTQLAKSCNYSIIGLEIADNRCDLSEGLNKKLIMVGFLKADHGFMGEKQFRELPYIDTGDLTYTGNYSQRCLWRIWSRTRRYAGHLLAKHPKIREALERFVCAGSTHHEL